MSKILVALSGGVDSAVSALLLKQAGHEVHSAYIKTWMNEEGSDLFADCPWDDDIREAEAVAKHLDIPFEVVNLIKDYRERVVQYLVEGYRSGKTPNPDIMCNREMKFGVFLDYALKAGFDGIATGHYCRKVENEDGTFDILQGVDKNKDQSYFLALVKQEQLAYAHFPVGDIEKPKVREIALKNNLPNANRKDSQGICFLGKIPINEFLGQYIEDKPGKIVNTAGTILGKHKGLHRYTIGQRKGIGVPSNADFEKYVVIAKDYETNQLIIEFESTKPERLFTSDVRIHKISYVNKPLKETRNILGKARYRDPSEEICFTPSSENSAEIHFNKPQRALAAGQLLALYDGEKLLGGGFYA